MGVNGRAQEQATWLLKLYWRSSCGRTLSPATEMCHKCGDARPEPTAEVTRELTHPAAPTTRDLLASLLDGNAPR